MFHIVFNHVVVSSIVSYFNFILRVAVLQLTTYILFRCIFDMVVCCNMLYENCITVCPIISCFVMTFATVTHYILSHVNVVHQM